MPEDEIVPQTTLAITTWSRSKRIAFLVNPEQITDSELNHIIRYTVEVWGGRFHAIIPTTGEQIEPDWWRLLVTVDPDIIYALLPLNDKLIWRINRHILPAKIFEVTPEDRARTSGRFHLDSFGIGALGIEDIPYHTWTTRGGIHDPVFFYIQDAWKDLPEHTFVLRNFGTLSATISMDKAFRDVPKEVFNRNPSHI